VPDDKPGWDWHNIINMGLGLAGTVVIAWVSGIGTRLDTLERANDKSEAAAAVEKEADSKAHAAESERDAAAEKAEKERIDALFAAISKKMGMGMEDRYTRDHHDAFAAEIRTNARERDQKIGRLDGIIESYLAALDAGG